MSYFPLLSNPVRPILKAPASCIYPEGTLSGVEYIGAVTELKKKDLHLPLVDLAGVEPASKQLLLRHAKISLRECSVDRTKHSI